MPSKNVVKHFEPDSMYHVYNRGVDKRIIFKDELDYSVFLSFLKYALLSDDELSKHKVVDSDLISNAERFNIRRIGLYGKVELVSFCLMPNHFHLLLYQYDIDGITQLMRSIATGYALYFNKRYSRVGTLFQGRYRASHIKTPEYWEHISRYIHLNPLELSTSLDEFKYSSYPYYLGFSKADWVKPGLVLNSFSSQKEYKKFVEDYIPHRKELKEIKDMLASE